jgi:hypothetical protein
MKRKLTLTLVAIIDVYLIVVRIVNFDKPIRPSNSEMRAFAPKAHT